MFGAIARLLVNIGGETGGLDSALKQTEGKIDSFANKLSSKINTRAFAIAGTAITGFGIGMVGLITKVGLTAARIEVLETVMQTVGKTAGYSAKYLSEQEEVIKALGITTKGAREILILFMQSQLDVADAAKVSRVAQDLAVISGQNSSDAAITLTNAISQQNPVLLRQFGILKGLDETNEEYGKELGLITEKIDKNGKVTRSWSRELTDVEKKQAMVNIIMKEGAKVAGTYEAAMEKAGKKLTSLPRLIEEVQLAIGNEFLPIIGLVIDKISELLKWFTNLSPEIKTLIAKILLFATGLALILGPILLIIAAIPAVIAGFGAIAGAMLPIIAVGAVVAGIAYLIYKNWGTIAPKVMAIWERIKAFLIKTWEALKPKAIEIFGKIRDFLVNIWNTLKPVVIEVWGKISDYLIRVWEKISTKLIPAAIRLQKYFNEINKIVIAKLVPVLKKLWEIIKPIVIVIGLLVGALIWLAAEGFLFLIDAVAAVIDWFLNLGKTWENIKAKTVEIWEAISLFFARVLNTIVEKLYNTENRMKISLANCWESIKNKVIETWDGIVTYFQGIWETIKEIFIATGQAIWDWMLNWIPFLNIIVENWDEIVAKLKEGWDKILGFFIEKGTAIKDFFVNNFNIIRDFVINIWTAISNFFVNIWNIIYGFFKSKIDAIRDYITSRFTTIKTKTINIWNSILTFLTDIWTRITQIVNTALITIGGILNSIFTFLKDGIIMPIWNAIVGFFVTTWGNITRGVNSFKAAFLGVWNGIMNGVKRVVNSIIGIVNGMINRIGGGVNSMIRALNRIGFKVPDWLGEIIPGLAGKAFNVNIPSVSMPQIPKLALGGEIMKAGFVDVGERGRERIFLPKGAEVRPLEKTLSGPVKQEIHIHSEYNEELASKTFAKLFAQYVGVINK